MQLHRISILAFAFFFLSSNISTAQTGSYTALDFNGSEYVEISDNSEINPSDYITVEAWINASGYASTSFGNSILCKHGWSSGNQGYVLRCGDNGKLSFNVASSSGVWTEAVTTTSVMQTGKWYHVAGTFDGDTVSVYLNGQLVATKLYSGKMAPSSGLNPRIGDLAFGGGRLFEGQIDEVKIWKKALDENVIRDWMCRKVSSTHPNFKDLGGYWKLDEGSGTSTKDETGNASKNGLANSPNWVVSGAAIGDLSAHTYTGSDLSLTSKFGDVFAVKNISGSTKPSTFHIYVNNQGSQQSNASGVYGKSDSTHYFGIYMMDPSNATFDVKYTYTNYAAAKGTAECAIDMHQKTSGYQGTWSNCPTKLYTAGDSLVITGRSSNEFMPIFYETDSTKIISSSIGKPWYCGSNPTILTASASDSFDFKWYFNGKIISGANGQSLSVDSIGTYKVLLTRKGTSCSYSSIDYKMSKKAQPTVSFPSLTGVCEDVDSIGLTGGTPANGIYSGNGVVNNKYFSPSNVKAGNYAITYSYTDSNSCTGKVVQNQVVYGLPKIQNSSTLEVCDHNDYVLLNHLTPTGGKYTGKFIVNNYFRLDSANYKNAYFPFVYEVTNSFGCSNQKKDSILVKGSSPCTFPAVKDLCFQDSPVALTAYPSPGTYQGKGISGNLFDPNKAGVGKHLLHFYFTNQLNCTTHDSQYVVVKANGSVSWNFTLNTCQNSDSILLTPGTPTGGDFSGKGVVGTYFFPKTLAAGKHDVFYNSKDTNGCVNVAKKTVDLKDTAAISVTTLSPLCLDSDSIALTNATPKGGAFSGKGVYNNKFLASAAGSGNQQLTYQYTNTNGCISSSNFSQQVLKNDSIHLGLPKFKCTYDDPVFVSLYPTGGTLKGPGIITTLFSPNSAGAGNHLITYEINGSNGCKVLDSVRILVSEKPTVSLSSFKSACDNDSSFLLTGGLPVEGGSYHINGVKNTSFNPTKSGNGNYKVNYLVVNQAGCKDSVETNLRVNKSPSKPGITISKNTLISSASNGNQWFDKNGAISGAVNKEFEPSSDGDYYVVVSSDSGCKNQSEPFAFKFVGIDALNHGHISLHPNPSKTGLFQISGLNQIPYTVMIYNSLGVQIKAQNQLESGIIDLRETSNGVYHIQIIQDGNVYWTKVLVDKR